MPVLLQQRFAFIFVLASFLVACNGRMPVTASEELAVLPTLASTAYIEWPTSTTVPTATTTASPHPPTAEPTATATMTPTATATATVTPSPTPDPYADLTIDALTARDYGGGELEIIETLERAEAFARYLITYPSDALTIYGFMNVPHEGNRFPVVLVLHGYVNPIRYDTLAYTTRYADELAKAGFFVIHPNYRNHPPSDEGSNEFRVGYTVDVLNLIAIIQNYGGQPTGPLRRADPERIYLLGHSMGGGITLRALTVSPAVRAAVLYGSMSGDERQNYEQILIWSEGQTGREELTTPDDVLQHLSPINYLDRIQAAVGIHHGAADDVVPLEWSEDLCQRLQASDKIVECFTYAGQPHTFRGDGDRLFIQRVIAFFNRY